MTFHVFLISFPYPTLSQTAYPGVSSSSLLIEVCVIVVSVVFLSRNYLKAMD